MRKNIRVQDRVIGEEIAYQRKMRGWTQGDLAYESGVSASHISRLERGECTPTYKRLAKLEDAMNLPHGFFLKADHRVTVGENVDRTIGDLKLDIIDRELSAESIRVLVAVTKAVTDTLEELERERKSL